MHEARNAFNEFHEIHNQQGGSMKFLCSACVILVLLGGVSLWGQGSQVAQIAGTVHDESGATVPGAEIIATQINTGIARTAVTGMTGRIP
jgi:hypothetical protein